jgi:hypothetical protein
VKKLIGIFVIFVFSAVTALLFPFQAAPGEDVESNIAAALDFYKKGKNEEAIKALSSVLMVLHNKRKLEIKNINLCESIVGYGAFKKKEANKLKAGEQFFVYFELEGYGVKKENDKYMFWVSEDVKLTDDKGKVVFERDNFLSYKLQFNIPIFPFYINNRGANLKPGKYKYEFTIKDHIKNKFVSGSIDLEVEEAPAETKTGEQPLKK